MSNTVVLQRIFIRQWPALLLALLLVPWIASAEEENLLGGELTVRSAAVAADRGVMQLTALIQYPLSDQIRGALLDGVTLTFDIEIQISRSRRFWWDASLVDLKLERELSYQVVTDRYLVREAGGQTQESFPTLESALARLDRYDNQPVLVESQLRGEGPFEASVRAGVRRGHLPSALRTLAFWRDDWYRSSPWYTWTLTR